MDESPFWLRADAYTKDSGEAYVEIHVLLTSTNSDFAPPAYVRDAGEVLRWLEYQGCVPLEAPDVNPDGSISRLPFVRKDGSTEPFDPIH
jgi:hypothetical protein